jgi:hypothetical protein
VKFLPGDREQDQEGEEEDDDDDDDDDDCTMERGARDGLERVKGERRGMKERACDNELVWLIVYAMTTSLPLPHLRKREQKTQTERNKQYPSTRRCERLHRVASAHHHPLRNPFG